MFMRLSENISVSGNSLPFAVGFFTGMAPSLNPNLGVTSEDSVGFLLEYMQVPCWKLKFISII